LRGDQFFVLNAFPNHSPHQVAEPISIVPLSFIESERLFIPIPPQCHGVRVLHAVRLRLRSRLGRGHFAVRVRPCVYVAGELSLASIGHRFVGAFLFPVGDIQLQLQSLCHPVSSLFSVASAIAIGAVLVTLYVAVDAIERLRDRVDEREGELNSRRSLPAGDNA
jgi:hypothetical protein